MALLTKIHHSVVDGVSGNEILSVLLDPRPEGREIPPPERAARRARARASWRCSAAGLLGLPLQPLPRAALGADRAAAT